MKYSEAFSSSIDVNETHLEERELSAFIGAVTELFGPEQARAATEDWLEEAERVDCVPRPTNRAWRSVTIAASARLASRIDAAQHREKSLTCRGKTGLSIRDYRVGLSCRRVGPHLPPNAGTRTQFNGECEKPNSA